MRRQPFKILRTSQTGLVCNLEEIPILNQSIFHYSGCDFQFTIICLPINRDDKSGNLLSEHVLLAASLNGYHHLQKKPCEKKFEFKNSLSNHIKSHSGLKRYQCQDCGRRFKKEGDYLRHRNCCGAPHKYKCEKCEKTFMNMNSLTNHIRVHNNEKPFQCSNCSARFKKLGDLTNHEVKIEYLDSCK